MTVFHWTSNFDTGLPEVDAQHRVLVDMLNRLEEAVAIGAAEQELVRLLDGLVSYTKYHFEEEEQLMAREGFDPYVFREHCDEHRQFVDKVVAVQSEVAPGTFSKELLDFLVTWLTEHILGTDQRMARMLHALQGDRQAAADGDLSAKGSQALAEALRESESRFRGLADSVPALIWMADKDGNRVYINRQWETFTGLPADRLLGSGWLHCVHPEDMERIAELYEPSKLRDSVDAEYRLRRADGGYRWYLESAVPRRLRDGSFAGVVGCAFDITERRQVERLLRGAKHRLESMVKERTQDLQEMNQVLEQRYHEQQALVAKLKETQAQLLQSEKMAGIGQLAAGVAHEINNPVGYVYSNLSALKDYAADLFQLIDAYQEMERELPESNGRRAALAGLKEQIDLQFLREDMINLVEESLQGVVRTKDIVRNLKDFSRIDHQEKSPFDVEAGLDATLNIVHNELKYKADVVREYTGLEPLICVGAELNQVFMNLLVNAGQAIDQHGTITVRTGRQGAGHIWVEVEDTGRGIARKHLGRLFEPFFTTKPVGEGTGLGLSVSYNIVSRHGGDFEVDSEPGRGTRFRVLLPVDDTATDSSQ